MNLQEAYSILELPETATPEEAKKKFKKLAAQWHPDVNKVEGSEAKFKQINEAYQIIESGEGTDVLPRYNSSIFDPFNNPFITSKKQYHAGNIDVHIALSFKESVQGIQKEIKYNRQTKCPHCRGSGNKPINNGCKKCGGQGQTSVHQGGGIYIQICSECMGRHKTISCSDCTNKGVLDSEASVYVSIPPAVADGNILRLNGMGNFAGTLMGIQDKYTDVYAHIHVEKDIDMWLEGKDVVSRVTISLLDALSGCSNKIKTIDGDKQITIDPRTKNKDEVHLLVGDNYNIKHRIIIDIKYPDDISGIVNILQEKGNDAV